MAALEAHVNLKHMLHIVLQFFFDYHVVYDYTSHHDIWNYIQRPNVERDFEWLQTLTVKPQNIFQRFLFFSLQASHILV